MKFQKIIALSLALTAFSTLASCGGSGKESSGNKMVIRVISCNGGVGTKWVEEAGKRFAEQQKDVAYGDKVGVDIKVSGENPVRTSTMASSAYNIYFDEAGTLPADLAQKNFLLDISDVLTDKTAGMSIEERINENYR